MRLTIKGLIIAFLFSVDVVAQSYDFQTYTVEDGDGLPQNFIYSIVQSNNGYIWIGTGDGLAKYDGINFEVYTKEDSLASNFVFSTFIDSKNVLWVGHDNGSISYYKNQHFNKLELGEKNSSAIHSICEDMSGNIWAIDQNNGIIRIEKNTKVTKFFNKDVFEGNMYYSIKSVTNSLFLVGTAYGLSIFNVNKDDKIKLTEVENFPFTKVNKIVKSVKNNNQYWIATEDNGLLLYDVKENKIIPFDLKPFFDNLNISVFNITDITEDIHGNLNLSVWGAGVVTILYSSKLKKYVRALNFKQSNGLNNNFIKCIILDREQNYWFGSYGGGLMLLMSDMFTFYHIEKNYLYLPVYSVYAYDSKLWMGSSSVLSEETQFSYQDRKLYEKKQGIPNDVITTINKSKDNTIWIGTKTKGLYFKTSQSEKFKPFNFINNTLSRKINDIVIDGDYLYVATLDGFYIINYKKKEFKKISTLDGLPHNNINTLYLYDNYIWLAPKSGGLCRININSKDKVEIVEVSNTPIDISGICSDSKGNLWFATFGDGVIKYNGKNTEVFTENNGLIRNYCYGIESDYKDRIWICHKQGLSCINSKSLDIRTFDKKERVGVDFVDVSKSKNGHLWFAYNEGVLEYNPDEDNINNIEPLLNFIDIDISGKSYLNKNDFTLPYPYGQPNYTFRFAFRGVSLKDPEEVTYQYRLIKLEDKEEGDWINLGAINIKEYEFLPNGKYKLQVRSFNADGVFNKEPIEIRFALAAPFWKQYWFYILSIIIFILIIYYVIKYREKRLLSQKEALQREVDAQTKLLRKQKAEIESKNQNITDSINYAKRIQNSILPPLSRMQYIYPESFVFFRPRDIVSGDFYWFAQKQDRFVICCADCTGHGVPGAFMSMIGTTLLNDINKLEDVPSPSKILEKLDKNIRLLLRSDNLDQASDGMDVSIIEINTLSNNVTISSAKRPVYLYINGELTVCKGTRRSIGDDISMVRNKFVNYEYQCSKNDSIYLFSDGYTDQFGGPKGKKIMASGVKRLLNDIHQKPMDNQYKLVSKFFDDWKEGIEQVDDVLFMGVKL